MMQLDRVALELHLTTASSHAELLGRRLRDAVANALHGSLAEHLDAQLRVGTRLLFIERLTVDCNIGAAWSDELVGRQFCRALASELARVDWSASTIAFHDRAEFVAAFIIALADGSAWHQWCFDEFDGLKLLPASGALRTVLINEGDDGRAALARLTDAAARRVLQCLSTADAERLLSYLLASQPDGATTPGPTVLLPLIDSPLANSLAGKPQRRLAWLIALSRAEPAHAHTGALNVLAWLETLRQAVRTGRLNAALDADLQPAIMLAACFHATGLDTAPLAAWLDADREALIAWLRELAPPGRAEPASPAAPERIYCPHGGAWLLLVQLTRLGWWASWQAKLHRTDPAAADALAARLALAVVARALGGQAFATIEADGALCHALGVANDPRAAAWPKGRQRLLARTLALPAPDPPLPASTSVLLGEGRQRRLALIEAARGTVVALYPAARNQPPCTPTDADLAAARAWWQAHDPLRDAHTPLERSLQLNALNLLREFASRLPGCGESSPAHLRSQCLNLCADVAIADDQIAVHVGRAPLDVLLMLAGIKRSSVTLPDGRALALQPEPAP